jgi:CRP-like cAMP-binding protein
MAIRRKMPFDVAAFLGETGDGRSLSRIPKGGAIFAQGDAADSVFYIRSGRIKITVVSAQGKEAVVAVLNAGAFFGEGCLPARSSASPRHRPWSPAR